MDNWSIRPEDLAEEIKTAKKVGFKSNRTEPRAIKARFDRKSGRIIVDLKSGVTFLFPVSLAQGLSGALPKDLASVEVLADGFALYWKNIDVVLSVPDLLIGVFGSKSWMAQIYSEIGRKGGSQTSPAKERTSRQNGRLGGRPRKVA
ncbi:MAG: DUF2442 domain-containing protein [Candidatus Riflebacteria bacterium]|nr:DUF2442 domain-containing protein [Candidatus Riflebacteria bacterium]